MPSPLYTQLAYLIHFNPTGKTEPPCYFQKSSHQQKMEIILGPLGVSRHLRLGHLIDPRQFPFLADESLYAIAELESRVKWNRMPVLSALWDCIGYHLVMLELAQAEHGSILEHALLKGLLGLSIASLCPTLGQTQANTWQPV